MDTSLSVNQTMIRTPADERQTAPSGQAVAGARGAGAQALRSGSIDIEALQARMESLAERLQDYMRENGRQLEFQVSDESGQVVILVRHAESGEVLRSIPPEEARALAEQASLQQQARLLSLEA